MTRIAIVGNGGSGKTWLARRLAQRLQVPAIHLDLYRYDADGGLRDEATFRGEVLHRLDQPSWVADGNYLGSLGDRLARADLVVFLDRAPLACLGGVLARRLRNRGRRLEDPVHVDRFDAGFVRYVLTYNRSMRPRLLSELASTPCRVVTIAGRRETSAFVDTFRPATPT